MTEESDFEAAKERARWVTEAHIMRVQALLNDAAVALIQRGIDHDKSKFEDIELEPLARMQMVIDAEGQVPYGTPEYKARTAMLGPMLYHHYANNSHHPEHYTDGVDGMNLFDVMEMFFDWKAASERSEERAMNLVKTAERYKLSPQLARIFANTADALGFPHQ